jgi:preprotein translocase subunit SecF
MLEIIQKRKYMYVFSGILLVLAVVFLAKWGLRLGLDFKGGTLMEIAFVKDPAPQAADIENAVKDLDLRSLTVQATGKSGVIIRYLASDDATNGKVLGQLQGLDPGLTLLRTDFIGASVSSQLKTSAFWGILFSVLGIAAYIAFAFRGVSRPIGSWEYGFGAVVALIHDILITVGVFSLLGHFYNVEVGVPFVAALLTILGYSVNDTIVVYDRVRENLLRVKSKAGFEDTVNRSVNETMARSINTSMTVIIVLIAIVLFGGASIKWFAVALLIGVTFGTYSSIFVASALLVSRYKMKFEN